MHSSISSTVVQLVLSNRVQYLGSVARRWLKAGLFALRAEATMARTKANPHKAPKATKATADNANASRLAPGAPGAPAPRGRPRSAPAAPLANYRGAPSPIRAALQRAVASPSADFAPAARGGDVATREAPVTDASVHAVGATAASAGGGDQMMTEEEKDFWDGLWCPEEPPLGGESKGSVEEGAPAPPVVNKDDEDSDSDGDESTDNEGGEEEDEDAGAMTAAASEPGPAGGVRPPFHIKAERGELGQQQPFRAPQQPPLPGVKTESNGATPGTRKQPQLDGLLPGAQGSNGASMPGTTKQPQPHGASPGTGNGQSAPPGAVKSRAADSTTANAGRSAESDVRICRAAAAYIEQYTLCTRRVHCMEKGVDSLNREGDGVGPTDVHVLASFICGAGCDPRESILNILIYIYIYIY